jgi:hypothetical protein
MNVSASSLCGVVFFAAWVAVLGCSSVAPMTSDAATSTGSDADSSDPRPALIARLAAAEAVWSAGKASCPTYHYVRNYSAFSGPAELTTVQVVDDNPSWRRFWQWTGAVSPNPEWTEGPGDIGSHKSFLNYFSEIVSGIDIPQLYSECRDILSADPSLFTFALETSAQGVPLTCTGLHRNCVDICSSGILVVQFACGIQDACLGPGCPGSGPYDYTCWRNGRCDSNSVCEPLPDGASCGTGLCSQGSCG